MKLFRLTALLLALLLLCSCSGQVPVSATEPTLTLPPVEQKYSAPVGDAALEYTQEYVGMWHNVVMSYYRTR